MAKARRLEGRPLARRIEADLKSQLEGTPNPCLAVVLVGQDPASQVYVERKARACERVGIRVQTHALAQATEAMVLQLVRDLNENPDVHGILVQLPLPFDPARVLDAIAPAKDVDGFHPWSLGRVLRGDDALAPCTARGIVLLLLEAQVDLAGANIVIVNDSNIVGKPLAALLVNRGATVTICHKLTRDVAAHTRHADVVVTGTGGARRLRAADIKEGSIVVDVSIVRQADGSLHGDCAPDVWDKAAWVTPVPGGVGPMTVAILLENTVRAFNSGRRSES